MILPGGLSTTGSARLVVLLLAGIASFLLCQSQTRVRTGAFPSANVKPIDSATRQLSTPPSSFIRTGNSVPRCARDVFVELHGKGGRIDRRACRGLLVRDDIIITSKDCSRSSFEFVFPGYGVVRADPHASLNAMGEMAGSRLGFLEARPPYHYHYVDRPVRRTWMFLGDRRNPEIDGEPSPESVIFTCGDMLQPIAHNFPSDDGEMVPLAELAGVVPDDVLWERRDLSTAIVLQDGLHRWWTRPITLNQAKRTIGKLIREYSGPGGSVSLPWAHPESDFDGKAIALLEAVDPRGHRRDCFSIYFPRWRAEEPFSGLHFFDWLDFSGGKPRPAPWRTRFPATARKICTPMYFNPAKVQYFDDEMRGAHEIYFEPSTDGTKLIARYMKNNEPVPPSDMKHPHLYVWSLDKKWYIVDDRWDEETHGPVKHSGVVAGRAALSGGLAYFGEEGSVWGIDFLSGHYRPKIQAAAMAYQWMKDQGFDLTAFHWIGRDGWSAKDCLETDWEKIDIPGFTAVGLNQACHDVVTSPTWIEGMPFPN